MTLLLPKLPRQQLLDLAASAQAIGVSEISIPLEHPSPGLAAVGGERLGDEAIATLRDGILEIARSHGFPSERNQAELIAFDARCAPHVHAALNLTLYEAANDEGWGFLTTVWFADVVMWRYGESSDLNRFGAHPNRNMLRRFWWRAEIFGDSIPLDQFGEDELVQMTERTTLTRDHEVARAIARAMLEAKESGALDGFDRMTVMREVTKRVLRITPMVDLGCLPPHSLQVLMSAVFTQAVAALSGESVIPLATAVFKPERDASQIGQVAEEQIHESLDLPDFSELERQVVELFLEHRTKNDILDELEISRSELARTIESIAEKLGVRAKRKDLVKALTAGSKVAG